MGVPGGGGEGRGGGRAASRAIFKGEGSQSGNKASRAIFASRTVGQYSLIIKINGTNSVNFVGNMLYR